MIRQALLQKQTLTRDLRKREQKEADEDQTKKRLDEARQKARIEEEERIAVIERPLGNSKSNRTTSETLLTTGSDRDILRIL